MATVTCTSCGWENEQDAELCLRCSSPLGLADGAPPPPPVEQPGDARDESEAADGEEHCPFCGAEIPDPGNLACIDCLRPFPTPAAKPPPPVSEAGGTRRDPVPGARLRLTFSANGKDLGEIDLAADEELLIGREPSSRCAAVIGTWDNVSRRHAVIGVDSDGAAWVRDEYSTNGTRLNDTPVRAGRRSVLQRGDRLTFGADVVAVVARGDGR